MNTRKDNNGRALKAWVKMGPGLIQKPLRHIGSRSNWRNAQGHLVLSPLYREAQFYARNGRGDLVTEMARELR